MSDDLLPCNATPQERAISNSVARLGAVPVVVREVWNPDTCPAALLGWLAWTFGVDNWNPGWSEAQKRSVIKNSLNVHKHKGTIGAIQDALGALSFSARVQEWFRQTPNAAPYTFKVLVDIDQVGSDQSGLKTLTQIIATTKNLRSQLTAISLSVSTQCVPIMAACVTMGNEISISNYIFGIVVFNETTICM